MRSKKIGKCAYCRYLKFYSNSRLFVRNASLIYMKSAFSFHNSNYLLNNSRSE